MAALPISSYVDRMARKGASPTTADERIWQPDPGIRARTHAIGVIGAGMIVADVELEAYRRAGFPVVAIASRNKSHAADVAAQYGIPWVHETPQELIADPRVEIVDIAFPPDQQPDLVRFALRQPHVRAILAQKPLCLSLDEAVLLRDEATAAGVLLSVNQNMRYDQSIRVAKGLIERGALGEPIFASIDMRAVPHWQSFLADMDRLTIANMSVHHLDALRFLFGEALEVTTVVRQDPGTAFAHDDGIVVSTIRFESGLLASSIEDVWGGPHESEFPESDYIRWRVEGTEGVAEGTLGWASGSPSTVRYASGETAGQWVSPTWHTRWFPDAFIGVMEQLQWALDSGTEPELTAADNVETLRLVEAAYRSAAERRTVRISEIAGGRDENEIRRAHAQQ
jgi:predicted dehydrogenase